MTQQSNVQDIIQQTVTHYRRQRLIHAGLMEVLGAGCVAALLARLQSVGLGARELAGVGMIGFLLLACGAWWSVSHARRAHASSLLLLDRQLGLHGRLLTALEFAHESQPPMLYPLLVQDTVQALPRSVKHTARVVDRRTLALAVVLLALLLWPWQRMPLTRLAGTKPLASPPSEPPQPPPAFPEQSPTSRDQQQRSQGAGQQASSAGNSPSQSGGGSSDSSSSTSSSQGRTSQTSGSDTSRPQSASSSPHTPTSSQNGQARHQDGTPQDGSHDSRTDGRGSQLSSPQGTSTQSSSPSSGTPQSPGQSRHEPDQAQQAGSSATSNQMSGSRPQSQSPTGSSKPTDGGKSGSANKNGAQPRPATSASASQPRGSTQAGANQADRFGSNSPSPGQGPSEQGPTGPGQGTQPLSPAQQAQLNGEIRQLLKEMSGELKQLQAQLEAKQQHEQPLPGASTDPDLYDRSTLPDSPPGTRLPILLDADHQPTSGSRRGGGVGESSRRAVGATPQQSAEDATLADQGAEETPTQRQAVPPEYRPVFERLSHGGEKQ